jgi:putative acetyltransferase
MGDAFSIRPEHANDVESVHAVNRAAFDSEDEANLVDALRGSDQVLSLVADERGAIDGHIMFSPVTLSGEPTLRAMALAPMAVRPDRQRCGVGSALVRAGLDACRSRGVEAIFVVGHPEYYPRFGFSRASRFGITCEFNVPDEAFMAIELAEGSLLNRKGIIRFHAAFNDV